MLDPMDSVWLLGSYRYGPKVYFTPRHGCSTEGLVHLSRQIFVWLVDIPWICWSMNPWFGESPRKIGFILKMAPYGSLANPCFCWFNIVTNQYLGNRCTYHILSYLIILISAGSYPHDLPIFGLRPTTIFLEDLESMSAPIVGKYSSSPSCRVPAGSQAMSSSSSSG